MQFVLTTEADYAELDKVAGDLLGRAMGSGKFLFLRKSVEFSRPRTRILIDRDRAGDLGISMREIGRNLSLMLGEGYVNRFSLAERSYQVIPQAARTDRLAPAMLDDYYVRAASGTLVPLGSLVRFEDQVEPSQRSQFQQLNSLNLEGIMAPGVTLGDAIAFLEQQAREVLPRDYAWDFVGQSR